MQSRKGNIKQMRKLGVERWKAKSGYRRRSLVDSAFYRDRQRGGAEDRAKQVKLPHASERLERETICFSKEG
jgi:hypothetical protein